MTTPDQVFNGGGYVSNEVIALQLRHLETTIATVASNLMTEMRLLRQDAVRRDVYDEQRRADQAELVQLREELKQRAQKSDVDQVKEELKEARQRKWAVWLSLAGVAFALGKDLLTSLIQSGG